MKYTEIASHHSENHSKPTAYITPNGEKLELFHQEVGKYVQLLYIDYTLYIGTAVSYCTRKVSVTINILKIYI